MAYLQYNLDTSYVTQSYNPLYLGCVGVKINKLINQLINQWKHKVKLN